MMAGNGKGLLVHVHRGRHDCTLGGLSSHFQEIVVFGTDEVPMDGYIDEDDHAEPRGELRRTGGAVNIRMAPSPSQDAKGHGPMMGGNYGGTSDSRFSEAVGHNGAVPIHDRYEPWDVYERLST